MSKKTLVIVIFGDFTLLENGSHKRFAELVRWADRNFPDVAVYSFSDHSSHPWTPQAIERFENAFPRVRLILDRAGPAVKLIARVKNMALQLMPFLARQILRLSVPFATPHYAAIRRRANDHLVIVNFVDGLAWLNGFAFKEFAIETHDIKFRKFALRYDLPETHARIRGKYRSEKALLSLSPMLVAISWSDAEQLGRMAPDSLRLFIPSYKEDQGAAIPPSEGKKRYDLLFVGANNNFNVDGLAAFLAANRPWLAKRPIAVAGAVCTAEPILRLAADWPSLNLLGYVEDLPATFAATKATLTPVEGTGLKIKMLEALEHGKPVFASDSARAGLPPGHGACVFGLDRRTIETLLDDPNALSAAELAAFQFHAILSDPPDRARFKVWIESALG